MIYEAFIVETYEGVCGTYVSSLSPWKREADFDLDSSGNVVEGLLENLPAGKAIVIVGVRQ